MKKVVVILLAGIFVLFWRGYIFGLNPINSITPTPTVLVDYQLPYPGILPDHPLYFLKVLRDRILGRFINDPVKKVEFELLMADKRIKMAEILFEEGKYDLSLTTASKGEKYLDQAVNDFVTARKASRGGTANLSDTLMKAVLKHKELIKNFMTKATSRQNEWQIMVSSLERNIEILSKAQ